MHRDVLARSLLCFVLQRMHVISPYGVVRMHYTDIIMGTMAPEITSLTVVYSIVYSGADPTKTSKLPVAGLCEGNSPVTGEFPAQMASNAENVYIWWRHYDCIPHPVSICNRWHTNRVLYQYKTRHNTRFHLDIDSLCRKPFNVMNIKLSTNFK